MWIFTNYGFVSAVQHRDKKNVLLVRAREPGVLEMLAKRHKVKARVVRSPRADYLYRAEFPKQKFAEMIADEITRIDYGNFKNSFKAAKTRNTPMSHCALMDVWCVMSRLQYDLNQGYKTTKFTQPNAEGGSGEGYLSWIDEPEVHR